MKVPFLKTAYCFTLIFLFSTFAIGQVKPNVPRNDNQRTLLDSMGALSSRNTFLVDSIEVLNDSLIILTRSLRELNQSIINERERNIKREAQLAKTIEEVGGTDWPSILIGGGIAIGATLITLLFQFWHPIRNRFLPEFTIQLNHDQTQTVNNQVVNAQFSIVMFSASPEKVRINYVFLEVPSNIKINAPSFSSLGDKMFGHAGRFYLHQFENKEVEGILYEKITITHQAILDLINTGKLSQFVIHVHTSKYGNMKSQLK
jgi:hypothetical protein